MARVAASVAGLLMLAACGAGDTELSAEDIAARGEVLSFSDSMSYRVWPGGGPTWYRLSCVEGSRIIGARGTILAVSGETKRPQDYRLTVIVPKGKNTAAGAVVYVGPAGGGLPAPYVSVEMSVSCDV